jgi:hypothetical protein
VSNSQLRTESKSSTWEMSNTYQKSTRVPGSDDLLVDRMVEKVALLVGQSAEKDELLDGLWANGSL